MPTTHTVFTESFQRSGKIKSGPKAGQDYVAYDFKASDGRRYGTFNNPGLAQAATSTIGKPVVIEYTEKQSGDFTNYNLVSVKLDEAQQSQPLSSRSETYPVEQQPAPQNPAPVNNSADRQTQINRSAGVARAIEAHNAGIIQIDSFTDVEVYAEQVKDYIENGPSDYDDPTDDLPF